MPVALEYKSDHLVIRLVGRSFLTAARRAVLVPYSDITRIDVETPRWPTLTEGWWIGALVPEAIAHGAFARWSGGERRFLHFESRTQRVLTIHLAGHPDFAEVSIEVRDPDAARAELMKRAGS